MPKRSGKIALPEKRLPKGLITALEERKPGMDTSELLAAVTKAWGGVDALAGDIRDEYMTARAGSVTRQRILEMVQRLIMVETERGTATAKTPSDLSTEELVATAAALMSRVDDPTSPEDASDEEEEESDEDAKAEE